MDAQSNGKNTALIWAVRENNTELGLALIASGANLDLQSSRKITALIMAATRNNKELGLALIHAGANQDIRDKYGKKALDYTKNQEMRCALNQ